MKTYGDIYNEFLAKFPNSKVKDYRPADPMFICELYQAIPNAIIVWLKDGTSIIYIAKSEDGRK